MSVRFDFPARLLVFALSAFAAISISGCGSSGSSPPIPVPSPTPDPGPGYYTVGGTVSGLTGSGLVLQINAGDNLGISANGSFSFSTQILSGYFYFVTVLTQPSNPADSCIVTNATGSVPLADVSNIQVTCSAVPTSAPAISTAQNQWTWAGGATVPNQAGVYGTQGTPSVGNIPGARMGAVGWTDLSGNFWLFGGAGHSVGGFCGIITNSCMVPPAQLYNDLWKFDGSEWTWVGGSPTANQESVYGTMGSAAAGNMPGARYGAVSWRDGHGNFWLFGGMGIDSKGQTGPLNELWEYSGGQWTWVGGANTVNQPGQYGTQGSPAAGNFPGSRVGAIAFADPSGNVWLFAGWTCESTGGNCSELNDLWEYTGGEWALISGSIVANPAQPGVYGAQGVAGPDYHPGGRYNSMGWMDNSGDLWTFGGLGYNLNPGGDLNDFWTHSNAGWAWMGGSSSVLGAPGTYGTMGIPAPGNIPGARDSAMTWTDANGNLWLFGGEDVGDFNDLWMYDGTEWTWVGGSNTSNQQGVYGSLDMPASGNIPGSRLSGVTWTDAKGNLWLFGGEGSGATGDVYFNDLWVYRP